MAEQDERVVSKNNQPVTPERLRLAATDAELRGDWTEAALFNSTAELLIRLESQNQAYRHALNSGVSIKITNTRRGWFR